MNHIQNKYFTCRELKTMFLFLWGASVGDREDVMSGIDQSVVRVLLVQEKGSQTVSIHALLAKLTGLRFILEEADSLSMALKRLVRADVNLVLLDLNLPDTSGLDGLKALRVGFPEIPVIVLSDSLDKQLAPKTIELGAKDYIVKDQIDSHLLGRIILRHTKKD